MTLHYCTVDDVKAIAPAAGRFDSAYQGTRDAVTDDFNRYIRRSLEHATGLVEYFNTPCLRDGASYNIWLNARNIDLAGFEIRYDPTRQFTDDSTIVTADNYELDVDRGRVTLHMCMSEGNRRLKVSYAGGYQADVTDTDRMDCPTTLRRAAIAECKYRIDALLNSQEGQQSTQQRRVALFSQEKLIDGLLRRSIVALNPFRRSLTK